MIPSRPPEDSRTIRTPDGARLPAREGSVPTLITLDVHEHPNLDAVVRASADYLSRAGQRATYFVPAGLLSRCEGLARTLRGLRAQGHAVGCHGLNHTPAEDLRGLSDGAEFALLSEATRRLEDALGHRVGAFRAPVFRLSRRTLPILAELGYGADLSVTPQRLSLLSSTPWCFEWLRAPRRPYRPHRLSPYRRGDLNLLEIPTSCLLLPFAHATMTAVRSKGMAAMLRALLWEALRFERVLVLLLHPESLAGEDFYWGRRKLRWTDFVPRRNGGLSLRYHFGDIPPERSQALSRELVAALGGRACTRGMSVDDYLERAAGAGARAALAPA